MATVEVLDSWIDYVETGTGEPVVFLHGNPTSSHLWRNVLEPVAASGRRCIAPDLTGMGESGKPDIGYRLVDHIAYVDGFIEALGLERITLVGHDWGAVIALDQLRASPNEFAESRSSKDTFIRSAAGMTSTKTAATSSGG